MRHISPAGPSWNQSAVWNAEIGPLLPAHQQTQARRLGAWTRTRVIPSVDAFLQALLCSVVCLRALRQLGAWATLAGLGSISDRAWSQRVRQSAAWVVWLLGEVVRRNDSLAMPPASGVRIRLIDASLVRMRSHLGRSARLHCSDDLVEQRRDHAVITADHQAEGIPHFVLHPGEISSADRWYCQRRTLEAAPHASASVVLRWHSTCWPLGLSDGTPFAVVSWLATSAGEESEQEVIAAHQRLRLVARRLSPSAAKRETYRRRRKAVTGGKVLQARPLVFASWLLLITTLPAAQWPHAEIFARYRTRWQIEMRFKRLKQLVRLHGLPSPVQRTNEAILALTLLGWALLDQQEARLRPLLPPMSAWQCTALLIDTWRAMLWGGWTGKSVAQHLDVLHRYLRPSRPPHKRWSNEAFRAHLDCLLQSA